MLQSGTRQGTGFPNEGVFSAMPELIVKEGQHVNNPGTVSSDLSSDFFLLKEIREGGVRS